MNKWISNTSAQHGSVTTCTTTHPQNGCNTWNDNFLRVLWKYCRFWCTHRHPPKQHVYQNCTNIYYYRSSFVFLCLWYVGLVPHARWDVNNTKERPRAPRWQAQQQDMIPGNRPSPGPRSSSIAWFDSSCSASRVASVGPPHGEWGIDLWKLYCGIISGWRQPPTFKLPNKKVDKKTQKSKTNCSLIVIFIFIHVDFIGNIYSVGGTLLGCIPRQTNADSRKNGAIISFAHTVPGYIIWITPLLVA